MTVEALGAIGFAISLLAGHRNFRLDNPKFINTLAWNLGINEVWVLIVLGLSLFLITLSYLVSASQNGGSYKVGGDKVTYLPEPRAVVIPTLALLSIITLITLFVGSRFEKIAKERTSNGVGQLRAEGLSPLGFQSALGATNQPAALVRLDGDYTANPFSPMLYLREQALSSFNGREMVLAPKTFDQDVPGITPGEIFVGEEPLNLDIRVPVKQSIYLLADHKIAFGLDIPISIKPFKNPNPSKFKGTYSVYSVAPTYKLDDLSLASVGDPSWTPETNQHYLVPHEDQRYSQLALKIAEGVDNPIDKAMALVHYFNKNAIYTLTPNHPMDQNADPVAQFLFGDLRGYCVHFAHAMTYLLRSLGIPARVATGYLSDLSQAKDGHLLLRMSDRHAWSEIYIQGKGWVPFDIQPEQVESHGESPVDMKLLEDLMSALEPSEEELDKAENLNETGLREEQGWIERFLPDKTTAIIIGFIILVLPALFKFYIKNIWRFKKNPKDRLMAFYRSTTFTLYDLGYRRNEGETRSEFSQRVRSESSSSILHSTEQVNEVRFDTKSPNSLEVSNTIQSENLALKKFSSSVSLWKRALGILSPASMIALLSRKPW